jgi:short-subunit dehydrogenase
MALQSFSGAVAVVTGGASGIGLATAHALATKGARLVLADINAQVLQTAVEQIKSSHQTTEVVGIPTDVSNEQQVESLMQRVHEQYGRIDLVVASAGIGRGGPIDMFTGDEMQKMLNVNFMGIYHSVRAALPIMRQQGSGHFVFLSSVAGKLGSPFLTAYCATKWAVRGFSIALRSELYGTGIDVTTVYPAWVDTPMIHQEKDAMQLLNIVAMLTPEQVANEILQAVQNNQRDLTLAPNPDIAAIIELTRENPDQAEQLVGAEFHRNLQQITNQG